MGERNISDIMDSVLNALSDKTFWTVGSLKYFVDGSDDFETRKIMRALVKDNYVKEMFEFADIWEITPHGLLFIEMGGYSGKVKKNLEDNQKTSIKVEGNGNIVIYGSNNIVKATISIAPRDLNDLSNALLEVGVDENDVQELSSIIEADEPDATTKKFGSKTKEWLTKMYSKALDGTWDVGVAVAGEVLVEILKKYYGW